MKTTILFLPVVLATFAVLAAAEEKLQLQHASGRELTAVDLEAFLDGFVPLQLGREDIAGAVIAVVKDGRTLFAKGYGYADVAQKKPVSASETLFRVGSISKLFTWTAVMQQVEEGKLDLDRDVNEYLDFKIPATFEKPVTLRHLMTHTAGFEDGIKELFVHEAAAMKPLGEYLATHLPARIFPVGTIPAYSNYGTTLAGYIVERVTGKPFHVYAAERLFQPLGMYDATFLQPVPAPLIEKVSQGYKLGSGAVKPFEFVQAYPCGSLSVSALDMARFALAFLQDGAGERGRILRPETVQLMFTRQYAYHQEMNGMGLGFMEQFSHGHRTLGHGGDTVWFHSYLHLIHELKLGFFVSYNSAGRAETRPMDQVWNAFMDRYFPFTPPQEKMLATAKDDARMVTGSYLTSRRSESNMLAALNLFGTMEVTADDDGILSLQGQRRLNGQTKRFREISPLMYREVDGEGRLAFQRGPDGRMVMVTRWPIFIAQQVGYLRSAGFVTLVLEISLGFMALTLLLWPVAALVRRHFGIRLELTRLQGRLRLAGFLVCALNLACLGLAAFMVQEVSEFSEPFWSQEWLLWLLQGLALLSVIGTLVVVFRAMAVWSARMKWVTRCHTTALALACLGFVWFVISANLLCFSSHY